MNTHKNKFIKVKKVETRKPSKSKEACDEDSNVHMNEASKVDDKLKNLRESVTEKCETMDKSKDYLVKSDVKMKRLYDNLQKDVTKFDELAESLESRKQDTQMYLDNLTHCLNKKKMPSTESGEKKKPSRLPKKVFPVNNLDKSKAKSFSSTPIESLTSKQNAYDTATNSGLIRSHKFLNTRGTAILPKGSK